MSIKNLEIGNHIISYFVSFFSVISSIVCCTWFIGTIEKRIALTEQHQLEIESRVDLIRDQQDKLNQRQDSEVTNYYNLEQSQIAQLSTRIEQIYQILLENKKQTG